MPHKKNLTTSSLSATVQLIERRIYLIRGQKVMIDADLAELYGVPTSRLNEQVSRNKKRFPEDFMFRLTKEEAENLRSQIATSSLAHGGRRYPPRAFTEQGVAMLSSEALRSQFAISNTRWLFEGAGSWFNRRMRRNRTAYVVVIILFASLSLFEIGR